MRPEGNFRVRFSLRKLIGFPKPYRVISSFFVLRNISTRIFGGGVSGNLPYKFKKSYGDFLTRNFQKNHMELHVLCTGPLSDLGPDS
jgi:hypothetical protein